MRMSQSYTNVFEALEDNPAVANNLKLRSELMLILRNYIAKEQKTQQEAAEILGVTQPRISDLMRGKIERFTIDMLVNMLAHIGLHVEMKLKKAA